MLDELRRRAKYEKGERVNYRFAPYFIIARYWRRATDEILYDLKEDLSPLKIRAKTVRKVPQGDVRPPQ